MCSVIVFPLGLTWCLCLSLSPPLSQVTISSLPPSTCPRMTQSSSKMIGRLSCLPASLTNHLPAPTTTWVSPWKHPHPGHKTSRYRTSREFCSPCFHTYLSSPAGEGIIPAVSSARLCETSPQKTFNLNI